MILGHWGELVLFYAERFAAMAGVIFAMLYVTPIMGPREAMRAAIVAELRAKR